MLASKSVHTVALVTAFRIIACSTVFTRVILTLVYIWRNNENVIPLEINCDDKNECGIIFMVTLTFFIEDVEISGLKRCSNSCDIGQSLNF